jgi:hypothetical protein
VLSQPSGGYLIAALAVYTVVSNLYLLIFIVYSVFGLAV